MDVTPSLWATRGTTVALRRLLPANVRTLSPIPVASSFHRLMTLLALLALLWWQRPDLATV